MENAWLESMLKIERGQVAPKITLSSSSRNEGDLETMQPQPDPSPNKEKPGKQRYQQNKQGVLKAFA